eukprot:5297128-Amphidinium_carterae.1
MEFLSKLCALMGEWERTEGPHPCFGSRVVLFPKGLDDFRPIALTSGMLRVWSRIRMRKARRLDAKLRMRCHGGPA